MTSVLDITIRDGRLHRQLVYRSPFNLYTVYIHMFSRQNSHFNTYVTPLTQGKGRKGEGFTSPLFETRRTVEDF